jgi:hypothetical protein
MTFAEARFGACLRIPTPDNPHFFLFACHMGAGEGEQRASLARQGAQADG